ncbi:uncharacterized protein LOC142358060, partial [Convolutriloba macropyga]|uniref:uncharacterized protein LOC142358060 n=1 Tax=Convolutriloba macropyga TaxID=536237 RepID=UPI003F522A83
MWTNAVNALGYLSLSGKVKEKFCWDMIEDNYDEAVHVPIKAGIIIMLLIMRSDTIPYTYEHTKQSKMAAAFYSLGKSSLFYKKYNKLTKLLQQQQFNQIHFQCNDCTPGFTDYIILVDFSNNIQPEDWRKTTRLIRNVIRRFPISSLGNWHWSSQFAIIYYSEVIKGYNWEDVYKVMHVHNYKWSEYANIFRKLEKNTYPSSVRNTHLGLKAARKMFQNSTTGSRIEEPALFRVLLVITSRNSSDREQTEKERLKLEEEVSGVKIISIGTTGNVSNEDLNLISGNPSNSILYVSAKDFESDREKIFSAICAKDMRLTAE